MKKIDGFSDDAISAVNQLLYAEGQPNPFSGRCGQQKLRQQAKGMRTPAQEAADRQRALNNQGKNTVPSAVRSEAAKKAAITRAKCRASSSSATSATTTTRTV